MSPVTVVLVPARSVAMGGPAKTAAAEFVVDLYRS